MDAINDTIFPGSIFAKVGLYALDGDSNNSEAQPWRQESIATGPRPPNRKSTVKINLYRGRELPPWDANTGALDAYAKITIGSQTLTSSVKLNSRNPSWYESLHFTTFLPPDKTRRPEVVIQIWDRDEGIGESDDFVGNCILRLNEDDGGPPKWRNIFYQEDGDISGGQILVGVEVVDEDERETEAMRVPPSPIASESGVEGGGELEDGNGKAAKLIPIQTKWRAANIDIIALSCRNLKSPSSFTSLSKPYAELHIAGRTYKTDPSSKPKPTNCNFSQPLSISNIMLPEKYEDAPFLDVTVYDKKAIGKTLLGTGSFWLGSTEHYKALKRKGVYDDDDDDDDDSSCCSSHVSDSNEWINQAPYMKNRETLLSDFRSKPIYSVVPLFRGKKSNSTSSTQKYELEQIGAFNVFAKISFADENKKDNSRTEAITKAMQVKQKFRVRLYCLDAVDLTAKDGKSSDPFLKVSLGSSKFESKKHMKTLKPEFYERFDMVCKIPGDSMLKIEVWDYDKYSSNDLIGSTVIDLESRWFSKDWRGMAVKPLEVRKSGGKTEG